MATWEDGPEYAPIEQPAQFTVPDVPPLSTAPAPVQVPAVPGDRPQFGDPDQPVAPLATLVPEDDGEERDPRAPFTVDSDAMTQGGAGGAWGAAHWQQPAGQQPNQPGLWGPPGSAPVAPRDPVALRSGPAPAAGNLPAPGTPAWFGPGPTTPTSEVRPASPWRAVPPAVFILLFCSLIYIVSPFSYLLAFILASRLRYARRKILIAFGTVFGVVLLISTSSALINYATVGEWYTSLAVWLLLGSLLMIVLIYVMVKNELASGRGGGPGGGSGGGDYRYQYSPFPRGPQ
jgi:hypothetical protein